MVSHRPEEGELVIATITKIQYHSIFCSLDEYEGISAMIHISELAPGRIKNVHEYVREGKTVVAKVLSVDAQKGHIDLSLRRVTEAQKRQKANERKQYTLVQNILEQTANETISSEELRTQLEAHYQDNLYDIFRQIVEGERELEGVEETIAAVLQEKISERIKPQEVLIPVEYSIQSYDVQGVAQIRAAFSNLPPTIHAKYKGAGKYIVEIRDKTYKQAEQQLKEFTKRLEETITGVTTLHRQK